MAKRVNVAVVGGSDSCIPLATGNDEYGASLFTSLSKPPTSSFELLWPELTTYPVLLYFPSFGAQKYRKRRIMLGSDMLRSLVWQRLDFVYGRSAVPYGLVRSAGPLIFTLVSSFITGRMPYKMLLSKSSKIHLPCSCTLGTRQTGK